LRSVPRILDPDSRYAVEQLCSLACFYQDCFTRLSRRHLRELVGDDAGFLETINAAARVLSQWKTHLGIDRREAVIDIDGWEE
jgi:hypothetical protein